MPKLKVEKRTHPRGEKGVRKSLEKVAEYIGRDYTHPKVRAWAVECLERARREQGVKANNPKQRAAILLQAAQRKLWVPDPTGTEWMAGAHLMACDKSTKDDVCILGSDCDCLCILLGSCYMSVGLSVVVVGHSYNNEKRIGHVLLAVRLDGKWVYADPSPDDGESPLGHCVPFTRERILEVPSAKAICDGSSCLSDPKKHDPGNFAMKGEFIGVSGTRTSGVRWICPTPPRERR